MGINKEISFVLDYEGHFEEEIKDQIQKMIFETLSLILFSVYSCSSLCLVILLEVNVIPVIENEPYANQRDTSG